MADGTTTTTTTIHADAWTAVRREVSLALLDVRKAQAELLELALMLGLSKDEWGAQLFTRVSAVANYTKEIGTALLVLAESETAQQFVDEVSDG